LYSEPTLHAQGCGFACFEKLRKRLHAVSSHENSSVADFEEYTKGRDVVNHADDCNQILEIPVGTVHSRLHHAMRAMRAALDADERPAAAEATR